MAVSERDRDDENAKPASTCYRRERFFSRRLIVASELTHHEHGWTSLVTVLGSPCDCGIAFAAECVRRRNPTATLIATILGSSMAFIDGSVVNVALPTIQYDLAVDPAGLSWIVNAYLLPVGALTLLGGSAGDRFGRRFLFRLGLALFAAASIACAAAPTPAWLLFGRAWQGIGAAVLMPNSLAILGSSFSGEQRGRAIGIWAAAGALAGAIGPLAGGSIIAVAGWRGIFLVNIPLALVAGYLSWRHIPDVRSTQSPPALDWAGALSAAAGLGLVTLALSEASTTARSGALAIGEGAFGAALLSAFVWIEARKGDQAIMPLTMFRTRAFVGLALLTFFLYASLGGMLVLLPYSLIKYHGTSPALAGAVLVPIPLLIAAGSPFMGRLTILLGARSLLTTGPLFVAAGLGLAFFVNVSGVRYWTGILPTTVLTGLGLALTISPLTTAVIVSVDRDHVGTASGLNNAIARIGGLVATALLGLVFATQASESDFAWAFKAATAVGAGCAVVAAICAVLPVHPAARESGPNGI